jgi:hypothetical protein
MPEFDPYLDTPGYGARWVAEVLNLRNEKGEPDERKAYHGLENGYLDADKLGRLWTSTPRRLLGPHLNPSAFVPATKPKPSKAKQAKAESCT